jgi:hypothetical protein
MADKQAAIVVGIGACIVMGIIVVWLSAGEYWFLSLCALPLLWWLFCLLIVRLSRASHRQHPYERPPNDSLELLRRVNCPTWSGPFQFSILTLLALMLVVALICSTLKMLR